MSARLNDGENAFIGLLGGAMEVTSLQWMNYLKVSGLQVQTSVDSVQIHTCLQVHTVLDLLRLTIATFYTWILPTRTPLNKGFQ
jgi:Tfp pilus assembly protein PilZ